MKAKQPGTLTVLQKHKAEKQILEDIIKEKTVELILARKEIASRKREEVKRMTQFSIARTELAFQNKEKGKRAAELIIANIELGFQKREKAKRAAELIIANKELIFQNREKGKRSDELIIANIELAFQTQEKSKRAAELIIANKEHSFQSQEKEKRAAELGIANKELAFQNVEKEKRAAELIVTNIELHQSEKSLQSSLKEISYYKYSLDESAIIAITDQKGIIKKVNSNFCKISKYSEKELIGQDHRIINSGYHPKEFISELWATIANGKIWKGTLKNIAKDGKHYWVDTTIVPFLNEQGKPYQYLAIRVDITDRKESEGYLTQRTSELEIVNKELAFQNEEKEKRSAELIIANEELVFQNGEKEKRAAELGIANTELLFQNAEKGKRSAELVIANKELAYQNEEKGKRSAELLIANEELAFQNDEKGKRSAELSIANKELAYQNEEKGKRSAELLIANEELIFQNAEKEKRAAELIIANEELAFQNEQKGKRSAELILANEELAYQNEEKGKRAAELIIANVELAYQNEEKEKRATELSMVNKELEQFAYIASHDLQQPLRTVLNYMGLFEQKYIMLLDENALKYISSVNNATKRMSLLIKSLLIFSQLGHNRKLDFVDCKKVIDNVIEDLEILINTTNSSIEVTEMPCLNIYETEMRQLFQNLITNAIKFQKPGVQPKIRITVEELGGKFKFSVSDNGIGIEPVHFEKVFDIFQRLNGNKEYEGSGIGLANCKKIVQLHQGEIWLDSVPDEGSRFHFTIPNLTK